MASNARNPRRRAKRVASRLVGESVSYERRKKRASARRGLILLVPDAWARKCPVCPANRVCTWTRGRVVLRQRDAVKNWLRRSPLNESRTTQRTSLVPLRREFLSEFGRFFWVSRGGAEFAESRGRSRAADAGTPTSPLSPACRNPRQELPGGEIGCGAGQRRVTLAYFGAGDGFLSQALGEVVITSNATSQ
jgi:hypothetical protein